MDVRTSLSRQGIVVGCALLLAVACMVVLSARARRQPIDVGFWFEPVSYDATEVLVDRLGGPLADPDLARIRAVALEELQRVFGGTRVVVTERPEATHRIRVVQELRNPRFARVPGPAGESRALPGLGGQSTVSFRTLANNAIRYAPPGTARHEMVLAIGRGVGRTAVHELAHQLLGSLDLHRTTDRTSYEYRSASRPEHYYGRLHWAFVWPELERRIAATP